MHTYVNKFRLDSSWNCKVKCICILHFCLRFWFFFREGNFQNVCVLQQQQTAGVLQNTLVCYVPFREWENSVFVELIFGSLQYLNSEQLVCDGLPAVMKNSATELLQPLYIGLLEINAQSHNNTIIIQTLQSCHLIF